MPLLSKDFGLRLLIGSEAATGRRRRKVQGRTKKHYHHHHSSNHHYYYIPEEEMENEESGTTTTTTTPWLWIAIVFVLILGRCIKGGWDTIFWKLEQFVVPFYTMLVLLYLTLLLVSCCLETIYRWWTTTTTTRTTFSKKPSKQTVQVDNNSKMPQEEQEEQVQVVSKSKNEAAAPVVATAATGDNNNKNNNNNNNNMDHKIVDDPEMAFQPFDLSGSYKLIHNDNFEGFLAVQGVPWALRRAANQARPIHRIYHKGNKLTIKIEGIIESQTTYIINGPAVETNVRGRIFEDVVRYVVMENKNNDKDKNDNKNDNNDNNNNNNNIVGICVSKTAVSEDYDVTVQRVLSNDLQQIIMTSEAKFRDGRNAVTCIQKFQRMSEG